MGAGLPAITDLFLFNKKLIREEEKTLCRWYFARYHTVYPVVAGEPVGTT